MAEINWGRKFTQLRGAHRLTQEQVADALGIKQNSYSLLETGTSEPKPRYIEQLAKMYNMSVEEMKAWEPGVVNQSHNNVANAYTTVEHQHVVSQEFVRDLMDRFDKRLENADKVNSDLLRMSQQMMEVMTKYFEQAKARK